MRSFFQSVAYFLSDIVEIQTIDKGSQILIFSSLYLDFFDELFILNRNIYRSQKTCLPYLYLPNNNKYNLNKERI